jgi:hypothetical protein
LPNFSLCTPFHFILANRYFDILIRLIESIEEGKFFSKFLEDENLIDKIVEMFIFILEEDGSYPIEALDDNYAHLPIDYDYYDFDEEPDETLEKKIIRISRSKVKDFLTKISQKICKRKEFTERDFNTY